MADYDPFNSGRFGVGVRTIAALDRERNRLFPCEIWYPAETNGAEPVIGPGAARDAPAAIGSHPLVVFSHYSGGNRRSASFVCIHLASHGYVVAALDHSEVIAADLAPAENEDRVQRAARVDAVIASRVPDVRFLIDLLFGELADGVPVGAADIRLEPAGIGMVGHSFGGWTVLAATQVEPRVRSVVALGPGGSNHPRPGILPLTLDFEWGRDVPALYLAAQDDVPIPLAGVQELFDRTHDSKRMFVLRRADHQHFLDDVEDAHEAVRGMEFGGDAAWIPGAMLPVTELCSGEQAHLFVRGLTLAHLDATLRDMDAAEMFLADDVGTALAARGVDAFAHTA